LHMAQLTPLPLSVSCFSKIQIGFTFLALAHLGSPGKRAVKWVCVYSRRQNDQTTDVVKVGRDCGVDVAESGTCAETALLYHSLVFLYIVEVGRNYTRRASQAGDGSLQC